ncbi:MAG: hypothetical protein ACTHNU_15660 [Gaiellales bacterium]
MSQGGRGRPDARVDRRRRPDRPHGHLCPVCMRPTRAGLCRDHGPWQAHQLASSLDRRRACRTSWLPWEPMLHACPRCLGTVAESRDGYECLEHAHGTDAHGPFRTDELLGPTAQREAAIARERVSRDRRRRSQPPISISLPSLADLAHVTRITVAAVLVAATLAFLAH